jgi:hypothetical protein
MSGFLWVRRFQIHIKDLNPHSLSANGWLEDVSKVEKYVMSDEDYSKRENTYRAHKQMKRKVHFPSLDLAPGTLLLGRLPPPLQSLG